MKAKYVILGFSWLDVSEWKFSRGLLLILFRGVTRTAHIDSAASCNRYALRQGSFRDHFIAFAGVVQALVER